MRIFWAVAAAATLVCGVARAEGPPQTPVNSDAAVEFEVVNRQMRPDDVDWKGLFGAQDQGARWLHTGGVFCALSGETPAVARVAMEAARRAGTRVSYDLNYRD